VQFAGFIPENKLNEFYNSLDVFVFPSFYEGFGLPVLEAMACGVPIITSNVSSMPELVGASGRFINTKNSNEVVNEIIQIFKDESLKEDLHKKGLNRAKEFTWEKCAKEHLKIYAELIK